MALALVTGEYVRSAGIAAPLAEASPPAVRTAFAVLIGGAASCTLLVEAPPAALLAGLGGLALGTSSCDGPTNESSAAIRRLPRRRAADERARAVPRRRGGDVAVEGPEAGAMLILVRHTRPLVSDDVCYGATTSTSRRRSRTRRPA